MISRRTLQHWTYPIRIGYWLRSIPFRWDWSQRDGDYLKLVYSALWRRVVCFNILLRALLIICIIIVTLRSHFDPVINVLSLFFTSIYTFSIAMQALMLLRYRNLHTFINKLMRLNQQLLRYYGVPTDFTDGIEGIAKAMKVAITIALVLNFPSGLVLISKGVGVFGSIRSSHWLVNVMTTLAWTFFQATDWNIALFYCHFMLVYVNAVQHWVGRLVWKVGLCEKKKATFRLLYRAIEILHANALEFVGPLMLDIVSVGGVLNVTSFYSVIRFPLERPNLPILFRVGLTGVVCSVEFTWFQIRARKVHENSENYPKSFILNDTGLQRVDRKFFKACRPLKFQSGGMLSYCRREFFLIYMEGFVLSNTLNLLLTFQ